MQTFLKGSNLEHEWFLNKNGVLLPRPGSQAAANIASKSQMSQGNTQYSSPMYTSVSQPQSHAMYTTSNNPVYGPQPQSQPRPTYTSNNPVYASQQQQQPRFGFVNNSVYTSNSSVGQPATYAQAAQPGSGIANPLAQFMSGNA